MAVNETDNKIGYNFGEISRSENLPKEFHSG